MSTSESGEPLFRLDIDKVEPADIFEWAKQQQEVKRERVQDTHVPDAIRHIADMMNGYFHRRYHDQLPELIVETRDAYHTRKVEEVPGDAMSRLIRVEPLPFDGDAALYDEHRIGGRLKKFHLGIVRNDLRLALDGDGKPQDLLGATIDPYISVGVESSNIYFADQFLAKDFEVLGSKIVKRIEALQNDTLSGHFLLLVTKLNEPRVSQATRLHGVSDVMVEIMKSVNMSTDYQLIDDIYDLIKIKLNLLVPQDIDTSSHRVVISKTPVPAYKPAGSEQFTGVIPELGMLGVTRLGMPGETMQRSLGLFFVYKDRPRQLPVEYITRIQRTES